MASPDDRTTATIFAVAKEAGVSITTVSHVFSGKRPVGDRTRGRVLAAAERLAYRPSSRARALATGRTMTLAVQFPFSSPEVMFVPYFTALLPALSEASVARGYAFVLVPPNPSHETFLAPLIETRGVDGAILLDPVYGDTFPEALMEADIPFVSLGRVPAAPDHPRVDQDFRAALETLLAHLRAEGYERPALLTLPGELSTLVDLRSAFSALVADPLAVATPDNADGTAEATAEQLLRRDPRPDAVVCLTERQAAGTYRAAATLGLRIPEDLGVVALGDGGMAREMRPPLTSVAIFPERAGRTLVEIVDALLLGDAPPPVTWIPTEIVPRESTDRVG